MTHPIDTSPEAIAALLQLIDHNVKWEGLQDVDVEAYRQASGVIKYLAAEIARLTAALEAAQTDAEFYKGEVKLRNRIPATGEGMAGLQRQLEAAIVERDEARAQVAMAFEAAADACSEYPRSNPDYEEWVLYDEQTDHSMCCIRALTPADAAAALARRDAAMRNEGRRQVKIKPLVWEEWSHTTVRVASAQTTLGRYKVQERASGAGWMLVFPNGNLTNRENERTAKAAAQADYEARILATLEPEGGE